MKEAKKLWIKPALIVIGRGMPEESVLAACKTQTGFTPGPDTTIKKCDKVTNSSCRSLVSS